MASKELRQQGNVLESLPNGTFWVLVKEEKIRCYVSGKMILNQIRILVGDSVEVEVPKGSTIGRIVYRFK